MALPASISIETIFYLRGAVPKFYLKSLTPLADLGTLTTSYGNFLIVNPLGVTVYENTSSVTPDLKGFSVTSITRVSQTATLTTSAAHGLVTGDWLLVAGANQTEYNGLVQVTRVNNTVVTYTVSGSPATPATGTITCFRSSLRSVSIPLDATTGLPILGEYTITFTLTVAATPYEVEFEYDNQYVRPTVAITQTVDCFTPKFTSTDSTSYSVGDADPTITRTHTIIYPADADRSNEVGVAQTIYLYYPKVYNGFYQTRISSDTVYTFDDDLIVWDTITGSQNKTVACDTSGCSMKCCLNELNTSYEAQVGSNPTEAAKTLIKLQRGTILYNLFVLNQQCGDTTTASANMAAFFIATECSSDCDCNDSTQVVPYAGTIGKTIQLWDDATAYSLYDYIDFEDALYRVLENTNVGDSPSTEPTKFQAIS